MFSALKSYLFPAPLTLVTASDTSHARSLMNFLASAKEHEPATKLIVYDLGLTAQERQVIESRFSYEIRRFEFERYPAFFDIKIAAGEYAWKPQLVRDVARESKGILCWMDAGDVITEPLVKLRRETKRFGYHSTHSSGTIKDWTHPGMLSYFGLPSDWNADAPNLNTACVAFDLESDIGANLVEQWAEGALVRDCIAPEGSSRANHRQDQALFTVLAYRAGRPNVSKKYLGYAIHRDVEHQPAA
ncbi:DUF1647 domain-containing protein [Aminobacter carboxidus]|uniref:DUF1647 domain-containing protein n=1 Tax=Aminobacter carboxidus TaxID=376165 RepID=A0ABR9GXU6_9HYPH|nr:DUF1647 domain-containing protein [Aminobacter carboxidus]MBE1208440.1 DUF1647 domain-containing protein [Aminobacter carboxidus]